MARRPFVQRLFEQHLGFFAQRRYPFAAALVHHRVSQVADRHRRSRMVSQLSVQGQALFEQRQRLCIPLIDGYKAGLDEGLRPRGRGRCFAPGEPALQPAASFSRAVRAPEPSQRARQPQAHLCALLGLRALFVVQVPGERRLQVAVLGFELLQPRYLSGSDQLRLRRLCKRQVVPRVALLDLLRLPALL